MPNTLWASSPLVPPGRTINLRGRLGTNDGAPYARVMSFRRRSRPQRAPVRARGGPRIRACLQTGVLVNGGDACVNHPAGPIDPCRDGSRLAYSPRAIETGTWFWNAVDSVVDAYDRVAPAVAKTTVFGHQASVSRSISRPVKISTVESHDGPPPRRDRKTPLRRDRPPVGYT